MVNIDRSKIKSNLKYTKPNIPTPDEIKEVLERAEVGSPEQPQQDPTLGTKKLVEDINKLPDIEFIAETDDVLIAVDRLPSQFMPYKEGVSISYRPYKYKEIDQLNSGSPNYINSFSLKLSGIQCNGMSIYDLTIADALYLMLLRRIVSLGSSKFQAHIIYEDIQYSAQYELSSLEFETLKVPTLPAIVVINDIEMHFKPLTCGNYLKLYSMDQHLNNRACMAAMCCNMEFTKAKRIIDNATGYDIILLEYIDEILTCDVKPLTFNFIHKGERVHKMIDVTDVDSLVTPFREYEEFEGNPIRFGLQQNGDS